MLRLLVALPLLLVLVLFALTPGNRAPVEVGLWPTDFTWEAPFSLVMLGTAGIFFFLGALTVWFNALAQRRRARRAERRVAALEAELKETRAMQPVAAPAATTLSTLRLAG